MKIKKLKDFTRKEIIKGVIGLVTAILLAFIVNNFITKKQNTPIKTLNNIENKGNLNIGQKGGTVTQTTIINNTPDIPAQRHLNKDMKLQLSRIPKSNKIELFFPSRSSIQTYKGSYNESIDFAEEILMFLINNGYSNINKISVAMLVIDCDNFFCIKTDKDNNESQIFILMQESV